MVASVRGAALAQASSNASLTPNRIVRSFHRGRSTDKEFARVPTSSLVPRGALACARRSYGTHPQRQLLLCGVYGQTLSLVAAMDRFRVQSALFALVVA